MAMGRNIAQDSPERNQGLLPRQPYHDGERDNGERDECRFGRGATVISLTAVCLAAVLELKRSSLAALQTGCGHFAFAFTRNRERPSAIRRAWARALTAFTVRPTSAAMSKTEALEMISFRSRFSSSEVQAFVLLGFFV